MTERRAGERYKVQFEATVTTATGQRLSAVGRVSDISTSGISVGLPFQLAAGNLVVLEIADSILHGHVIYSQPDNSLYRTGVEASRVLLGSTDLSYILHRILMETMPAILGLEPTGARLD